MENYEHTESFLQNDQDQLSTGAGILLIVGVIYLFGFVYLIYSRFMSNIIEDLIYLAEVKGGEHTAQIVYCILNNLSLFIITIIANFNSQSDLPVTTVFGTDIINICFLYPIVLLKILNESVKKQSGDKKKDKFKNKSRGNQMDPWLVIRDMVIYLIFSGVLCFFFFLDEMYWWMNIIVFAFLFILFFVLQKNDMIKDKVYKIIGLTNEDDSFNAEDQLKQKKNAIAIEYLIQNNFINKQADDLKKRIAKNEGLIIMKHGKGSKRGNNLMMWHNAVYTLIFAIKNKNNYEKQQRSKYYADLWKEEDDEIEDDSQQNKNQYQQLQNQQSIKVDSNNIEDDRPLINQQGPQSGIEINSQEQNQNINLNQNQIQSQDQQSSKNDGRNENDEEDEDDDEDDESDDEFADITMKFPQGNLNRLSYIVFFPFHLILFLMPNYHKDPSLMKLFRSFLFNLILLGGVLFLIEWWTFEAALALDIPVSSIGLIVISFGLQIPYIQYNLKICKKEQDNVEFYQSYIELGISKIGMVLGLPWLLNNLINLSDTIKWKPDSGVKYITAVFVGIQLLSFIFLICNSFYGNKTFVVLLVFFFLGFFIASEILLFI